MAWYGQSKPPEDQIAAAVFGDYVGTCVEVGAYNGIDLSNTYHFYLKGWRCINFEPHPINFAACKQNQPNAKNYKLALGRMAHPLGAMIKTAPNKPIVTGFDLPKWYVDSELEHGANDLIEISVGVDILFSVLKADGIEQLDYLSIDTDGTEMDVLHGFGFQYTELRPRLMIIEYNHALSEMTDYLSAYGYQLAHDNGLNAFYTRTQADFDAVQAAVR